MDKLCEPPGKITPFREPNNVVNSESVRVSLIGTTLAPEGI